MRTICAKCNSRTGGNYGTAYKDFVQQFARSGLVGAGQGRVVAFTGMMSIYRRFPLMMLSEISWPPVGIVFATEPHPLTEQMTDITSWGEFSFRARQDFGLAAPQLRVSGHWPLAFGSERDVDAWTVRDGIVVLALGGSEAEGTGLPVLTKQPGARRAVI